VAMDLASVMGSCSTGRATAVDSRTRGGDRGGGAQRHPGVQGAQVAVVGLTLIPGGGVGGVAFDRDVGVLGHIERGEPVVLGHVAAAAGLMPRSLVKSTRPKSIGVKQLC
jgi:hypothetical protein